MIHTDAIERGFDFLIARQDPDGAWRDFDLPRVGKADAWTTAYVGRCVRDAAHAIQRQAGQTVDAAAQFLHRNRKRCGGWGYNSFCPPDADSTAQALLLLRGAHARDAAVLARFQCGNGGFCTYLWPQSDHPWGQPQPEVTATALRALLQWLEPQHRIIQHGVEWLRRRLSKASGADSYWWTTPTYTELELLRLRTAISDAPSVASIQSSPSTPFEAALVLECATLLANNEQDVEAKSASLLAQQRPDGGWPSGRILRLPDFPDTKSPNFEDTRRLFTTASAISALSSWCCMEAARGTKVQQPIAADPWAACGAEAAE